MRAARPRPPPRSRRLRLPVGGHRQPGGAPDATGVDPLVLARERDAAPTARCPSPPSSRRSAATRSRASSRCRARASRSRTSTARAASTAARCASPSTGRAATSWTRAHAAALAGARRRPRHRRLELERALAGGGGGGARRTAIVQITNVSTARRPHLGPATRAATGRSSSACARSDDVMGELLAGVRARPARRPPRGGPLRGRPHLQRAASPAASSPASATPAAGRAVAEFYYLALETDFRPQLGRIKEFQPGRRSSCPGSFPDATLVAVQAAPARAPGDAARRRRLVEPAAVPAGGAARATRTTSSCARPPPAFDRALRGDLRQPSRPAAAPCSPTTRSS